MTQIIRMPKLSDTMQEGTLLLWLVAVGDSVAPGQVIAEIANGRATVALEAGAGGVVEVLHVPVGQKVSVGSPLVTLHAAVASEGQVSAQLPDEKMLASPAARKLALELGLDLKSMPMGRPHGRITLTDAGRAEPRAKLQTGYAQKVNIASDRSGKSIKVRRLLARKMEEAWRTIPHFYVSMSVDMTDVIRFRKDLGVTINDFVLAATARALQEHPWVNASWNGEQGIELVDINIAMAVATDRGLYNPVIHNCEKLNLKQISAKSRELVAKAASQGRLKPEDMAAGTFTISNMGMLGVESFAAIITPPQAAVLSVGTVKGEIVVDDQGEPAVAPVMQMTLSADHRVLDGADAAEFLSTVKSYLEAPIVLVSERLV